MQGANALDSGVYECFPDNAPPAKIKVHILTAGNILENGNIKKTFTLRTPLLHNLSFSANCTVNQLCKISDYNKNKTVRLTVLSWQQR